MLGLQGGSQPQHPLPTSLPRSSPISRANILSRAKHSSAFIEERGEEGAAQEQGWAHIPPLKLRDPHPKPLGGGSGEEQGCQEAGKQQAAAGEPGGAVAEIGVAAVDADPRQLLLLAVTGGGTAAGQQAAQDHCKASRARGIRDRGCEASGFALGRQAGRTHRSLS